MAPYFEPDSRSCTRCGALVPDPGRTAHVAFHERVDPEPPAAPDPDTPEEPS